MPQNYLLDLKAMRYAPIDDDVLQFSRAVRTEIVAAAAVQGTPV
jgi:hypothetical protein